MKNIAFLLFLGVFNGFSQTQKHFVIKTNSLNYLVKTGFNIALEFETVKNHSFNVSFEIGDRKINYENLTGEKDKFVVLTLERRKYFHGSKKGINPSGIFVGPFLKYRYKDKVQPENGGFFNNAGVFKAHFIGLGYIVGYQNHIAKRIAIETKLGLGIQGRISIKGKTNLTPILPDGLLGLSIGFRI